MARLGRRIRDAKGQASIMIGMMMLTFILFFAFVINTGMLVNAKINLQNAADMAAYAGAAVQARQLNQISYLNYEMRRQYKKFLFRYYVMGNMAQDPFPRTSAGGAGATAAQWSPDGTVDYESPVVCMIFNSSDNFCHLAKLPKIEIPPPNALDTINQTLITQLKGIEQIRQDNCKSIGITNTTTLRLWLWNTDPDLIDLQNNTPPELTKSINTIRGLAMGLGLIPRELLLRSRIETLKGYVNQMPESNVTYAKANAMVSTQDPPATERTQQAFFSAFYTLGEHTFNSSDIIMDELTPPSQLKLNDIKATFDTYAMDLDMPGGSNGTNPADCVPIVQADTLQSPLTLGVSKDPKTMTFYAIRLKAKAQILFSPFGDVTLKAYSAAQPFGSRIGPALQESDFVREDVSTGVLPNPPGDNGFHLVHKIPNLALREQGDSASTGKGWDTREVLGAFYQGFKGPSGNGAMLAIDQTAIQSAVYMAMAPNPFETNKYNIINDQGDAFVRYFDTRGVHAFWAPVFPPDKASQADSEIQSLVQGLMGDTGTGAAAFKQALTKGLTTYVSALKKGQGEAIGGANEAFNIAYIQDSIHYPGITPPKAVSVPGLVETDPAKLKSSWNAVLNGDFKKDGRVGYSVKFVSFSSLTSHSSKTDGTTTWNNPMTLDDEANMDLSFIQH